MNLPIVPITDLTIKDDNLIVATQGRSLWIIDDLTVLHQLDDAKKSASAILYKPRESYRTKGNVARRPSKTEGTNLANGVITHFYLKDVADKDSISLTYTKMNGDTLATYSTYSKEKDKKLEVKKGGNTHVWDTRGKSAERLDGMILWWANLSGPKAVPGTYKVHLNVNGKTQTEDFKILPDPRAEASVADMQKQYDFISEINETIDLAHQSIKKIRGINKKLDEFIAKYKGNDATKEVVEKAKAMKEKFGTIEKELYQTQNRSGQDPLNFPIRLTNKLGHLNSLVSMDDFPPTEQDIAVKEELSAGIKAQLADFDKLVDDEVAAFNAEFNKLNLDYLSIEE